MGGGGVTIGDVDKSVSYYEGRLTLTLFWAILVSVMGGALFGYDLGVAGGVSSDPNFLELFFPGTHGGQSDAYCTFNNLTLQLFTSSLFIAAAFSGLVANFTSRSMGRVFTMGVGGLWFLLGALLTGLVSNTGALIFGRICLGIGVGLCAQSVPTYLAEVSPPNMRGTCSIMFQLAITLGILVAQLLNYLCSRNLTGQWVWRIPLLLAGVPALFLIIGWCFLLPESANSLVERNQVERAKANLKKFRGRGDVDEEFADLLHAITIAQKVKDPYLSIFRRQYRPELIMSLLIPLWQQLTGINSIMFYAPMIFASMGNKDSSLLSTLITGGVNVVATFIAIYAVDKCGRRWLFVVGGVIMVVAEVLVTILLATQLNPAGAGSMPQPTAMVVLVVVCAFTAAFAFSWGPLGWLVPAEIQSLQTRAGGMAITTFVNFAVTAVIGQAFLSMLCSWKAYVFLFFAGWATVMTLFIFFWVPETKKVPIEEMGVLWANHWFWRRWARSEERPLPTTVGAQTQTGPSLMHLGGGARVAPADHEVELSDTDREKLEQLKKKFRIPLRPGNGNQTE